MKSAQLHENAGQRTLAVVFDKGDEVMSQLTVFAREHGISAAQLTSIGALHSATLGCFDPERKDYLGIRVHEQVEVLAPVRDVALADGEPKGHAHVVVGKAGGMLSERRSRKVLHPSIAGALIAPRSTG